MPILKILKNVKEKILKV